jgi:hypothetical protein
MDAPFTELLAADAGAVLLGAVLAGLGILTVTLKRPARPKFIAVQSVSKVINGQVIQPAPKGETQQ